MRSALELAARLITRIGYSTSIVSSLGNLARLVAVGANLFELVIIGAIKCFEVASTARSGDGDIECCNPA
jgi:hypothetical protein